MTDYYMDTDGGSDGSDGTTWSDAKLTFEGLLAVMAAGDRGFIQGAADDSLGSPRTWTCSGTQIFPCIFFGVVDGTTAEPPVLADIAVTLPVLSTTGNQTLNTSGSFVFNNIHVDISWRMQDFPAEGQTIEINNGQLSWQDRMTSQAGSRVILNNSVLEFDNTGCQFNPQGNAEVHVNGGSLLFTVNPTGGLLRNFCAGRIYFNGVDMSGLSTTAISGQTNVRTQVRITNCETPATVTLNSATSIVSNFSVELIASNDASSVAIGDSIQDYEYEDAFGTIDLETTAVRTNGADDDASGVFAYAMTPLANSVLEGTSANLASPWMDIWLVGGLNTITVYIANDSASTDYNLDEVWLEVLTPDAGDTAAHDLTFDAADERLFPSSTAITDDTGGSTWGTGANNYQKLSVTVTTGFEGEAQCRLHIAKRQATPDTLFLDPLPEVT